MKHQPSQTNEIEVHLKAAVMIPSNDYMPRFHLACFLFQTGKYPEAYENFALLNEIEISRPEAYQIQWNLRDASGASIQFNGEVASLFYDYGFIRCDFPRNIYFNRWALTEKERQLIRINIPVRFFVGFSLRGPVATKVQSIKK